ncbi:MAG: putative baseplate assembly protein, partial [Acidimicrobiales bacterium]
MSEMMLFRLNQVPDSFYLRMLNLLGVETFPASAASADLTFWAASGQDTARIAAGTEIATSVSGTEEPIVFTTVGDLEIV